MLCYNILQVYDHKNLFYIILHRTIPYYTIMYCSILQSDEPSDSRSLRHLGDVHELGACIQQQGELRQLLAVKSCRGPCEGGGNETTRG